MLIDTGLSRASDGGRVQVSFAAAAAAAAARGRLEPAVVVLGHNRWKDRKDRQLLLLLLSPRLGTGVARAAAH